MIRRREPLPIDEHLPAIAEAVASARAAVISAAPGAGKTTRVPPALLEAGRLILLQPRRMAARAIARRIAVEQGWTAGDQIGWQVRFERRASARTRLLVVTEGILTASLQRDPLLTGVATVVIDEFHERSIHADLGLALAYQAWLARDDLRLVIMSATLDTAAVSHYLGGCPVIDVPGRLHPVRVTYAPGRPLPDAALDALHATAGDVLCFLPGSAEIERAATGLRARVASLDVLPLHGGLGAEAQDRVFSPPPGRRVVLATNIAETSITVPRVSAVVDSGLHKVARYDPARAIDSLDLARIPQDAADQRAGRAGRAGPGFAIRLWDARDRLAPHRQPEIARVDLASTVLDVLAWGGDPESLLWFETPPAASLAAAMDLLDRLGATHEARLTDLGRQLQRLPLHPRLGRLFVEAGGAWQAALACAVLSERTFLPESTEATSSDLLSALDRPARLPPHVRHAARHIHALACDVLGLPRVVRLSDELFRKAILAGYPDRVVKRRVAGSPRLVLASGHGARLHPRSGVLEGEFLVAIDVQSGMPGSGAEAIVRLASRVERAWLAPLETVREHRWDEQSGTARAVLVERYGALVLAEHPVDADPAAVAVLLTEAYRARGPSAEDKRLLRRLAFAGLAISFDELLSAAVRTARRLDEVSLASAVPFEAGRQLARLAPDRLPLPSGRSASLDYHEDGTASASVKLQELFGLRDTPTIGPGKQAVRLLLLAPNGRPVQTTSDLRSFWDRTYPEVRRELRGRYPRHPWPEDPWSATPTHRPALRSRKP